MNEYEIESWLKGHLSEFAEANITSSKWEIYFDDLVEMFIKYGQAYYDKIVKKGGAKGI